MRALRRQPHVADDLASLEGDPNDLERRIDEESAARALLEAAQAGLVIVLPIHTREVRERLHAALAAGGASASEPGHHDPNHIPGQ